MPHWNQFMKFDRVLRIRPVVSFARTKLALHPVEFLVLFFLVKTAIGHRIYAHSRAIFSNSGSAYGLSIFGGESGKCFDSY